MASAFAATSVAANNPADRANKHEQRAEAQQLEREYMAATMRARAESKRSAKIERRENVSL
jgi:hypothetical protein